MHRRTTIKAAASGLLGSSGKSSDSDSANSKRRRRKNGHGFLPHFLQDPKFGLAVTSCVALVLYIIHGVDEGNGGHRKGTAVQGDDHLRSFHKKKERQEPESSSSSSDGGGMNKHDRKVLHQYMNKYRKIRVEYDKLFPDTADAVDRRLQVAEKLRKRNYRPVKEFDNNKDCPIHPPKDYPKQWPITDIIENWNPNDTAPQHTNKIYQGICVFEFPKDKHKAINYRNAEVPFVVRNDPDVLKTVERWNHPDYLHRVIGKTKREAEFSKTNHFMYFSLNDDDKNPPPEGWEEPTEDLEMTYGDWLKKASQPIDRLGPDKPHWYFRMQACGLDKDCSEPKSEWLYHELEFFRPSNPFYIVEKEYSDGLFCLFGMTGVIAEEHFDTGRNMIALMGGERRYILSHPDQCENLHLYPPEHPSGRHSAVDWTNPDVKLFPKFAAAVGNEIVLQAGDILYIPALWFHFITSLETNYQCNTRSGDEKSPTYGSFIDKCGYGD